MDILRPTALLGTKLLQNDLCVQQVQAKVHKKRRNQTQQYHRRINKKWGKRYGTKLQPCAYRMADGTIITHPSLYAQFMKLYKADFGPFDQYIDRTPAFL